MYVRKSYTKNQIFISEIDQVQHRVLVVGFYTRKSAKKRAENELKMSQFAQN